MMRPRAPLDPAIVAGVDDEDVLRRFVASVRGWRGGGPATPRFRSDDLLVLARILGSDAAEIERRLVALTGCDRATATRLRRLLLIGLASMPVLATGLASAAPAPAPAADVVVVAAAEVAALVQPEPATATSSSATAPVTTPTPTPAPAPVTTPGEAVGPTAVAPPEAPRAVVAPGAEATVVIARLGIELPVVAGGQDVIDTGVVAHYWAPGWREPVAVGAPGTYWLAAHHETRGAPFLRLPEAVVGDRIEVSTPTQTVVYTVTSMEVVLDDAGFDPVYGTDPAAPRILLQTCLGSVQRLLVHGELTADP